MHAKIEETPSLLQPEATDSDGVVGAVSTPKLRLHTLVVACLLAIGLGTCAVLAGRSPAVARLTGIGSGRSEVVLVATCAGDSMTERCSNYCKAAQHGGSSSACVLNEAGAKTIDIKCHDGVAMACDILSTPCFPGDAVVQARGRGQVPVSTLRVGDEVLVAAAANGPIFEPVLDFLHVTAKTSTSEFLILEYARGALRVSANHLVFVSASTGRKEKFASEVAPGDELMLVAANGEREASVVLASRREAGTQGMFAPHTPSGEIVVDGVSASNYANVAAHAAAHAFFFPARAYHRLVSVVSALLGSPANVAAPAERIHPLAVLLHNEYFKVDKMLVSA